MCAKRLGAKARVDEKGHTLSLKSRKTINHRRPTGFSESALVPTTSEFALFLPTPWLSAVAYIRASFHRSGKFLHFFFKYSNTFLANIRIALAMTTRQI